MRASLATLLVPSTGCTNVSWKLRTEQAGLIRLGQHKRDVKEKEGKSGARGCLKEVESTHLKSILIRMLFLSLIKKPSLNFFHLLENKGTEQSTTVVSY